MAPRISGRIAESLTRERFPFTFDHGIYNKLSLDRIFQAAKGITGLENGLITRCLKNTAS
jgi:hypothetical protein